MNSATSPFWTKQSARFFTAAIFIACLLLGADLIGKFWTHHNLPLLSSSFHTYPYGGVPVFKDFLGIQFSLNYVANTGAAWGLFGDYPKALVALRVILILATDCYILFCCFSKKNKSWIAPLFFISLGATGNVLDYMLWGHVIDMLHFNFWGYDFPVFNLSDVSITIGVCWLFFLSLNEKDEK